MTNIELQRRDNETPFEHHKRIIYGKRVDKTLADMDYAELSKFAYGRQLSFDVARRMFQGSEETLMLLDKERSAELGNENLLSELDEKIIELRKERQRFFDQRREYNKLVSADGRREHIQNRLVEAATELSNTVGNIFSTNCIPEQLADRDADRDAVLVFSDWHYGMVTNNVFNTYNTEICRNRVVDIVNKAKQRILQHKCSRLHIITLGDLFHGAIHTSARVASEENVCDQLMQVSEILAQAIIELSDCVSETFVYSTYGNHARTIQNKHDSTHRDNMERIIPWWIEQRIRAEENKHGVLSNITIVPDSGSEFTFANVQGYEFCSSHGDLDSVKTSPRLLSTLFRRTLGRDVDYILLGDKHHRESFDEMGISSMLCGSLCGTDDYANDKRLFSKPSQLLLIVSKKDGVDAEYRLKC